MVDGVADGVAGGQAAGAGGTVVGVGVDLVDVARVEAALARTPGLAGRICSERELRADRPAPGASPASALAHRFAVKEAAMKALGGGIDTVAPAEVEVGVEPGRPISVSGRAADRAEALGVARFEVAERLLDGPRGPVVLAEVVALGPSGPARQSGPPPAGRGSAGEGGGDLFGLLG